MENKNKEKPIITVDWTKENLLHFLETKLNLDSKILSKISEKEIDGDALILLSKKDFKDQLGINMKERKNILNYIEKDILKINNNIKQNVIYEDIYSKDLKVICESLNEKLEKLKFGERLKYLKYLIIKNPPPEIKKKNDLDNYLKTILTCEDNIKDVLDFCYDDDNNILELKEEDFEELCKNMN